jgi:hypothetical protein
MPERDQVFQVAQDRADTGEDVETIPITHKER